MKELEYIIEDVRSPKANGEKCLIIHCVNDIPAMGSGVAKALFEKWPSVRSEYMEWGNEKAGAIETEVFKLGNIQPIRVEKDIAVINMVGQHGITTVDNVPPIRYDAMRECIKKVAKLASQYSASVHVPYKMGSDLAGGKWEEIEKIIKEELCANNITVKIYDVFNQRKNKPKPSKKVVEVEQLFFDF